MSNGNNEVLCMLAAGVILIVGFLVVEYLTRRVRYFRQLRRNTDRLVPKFGDHTFSLHTSQKMKAH